MMHRVHSGFPQAPRERGEAAMYELRAMGLPVTAVEVDETPNNRAVYRP